MRLTERRTPAGRLDFFRFCAACTSSRESGLRCLQGPKRESALMTAVHCVPQGIAVEHDIRDFDFVSRKCHDFAHVSNRGDNIRNNYCVYKPEQNL